MTAFSEKQAQLSCSKVKSLFAEKMSGGGLSLEEQRLVDAHLNRCSVCGNIFKLTSALPAFAAKTVEGRHDAAIATVMENLRRHRETKTPPAMRWQTFAVGAAIAALTLVGGWNLRSSFTTSPADDVFSDVACAPSSPEETVSGVYMAHCDTEAPETIIENGEVRVLLRRGSVALFVDPERPVKKSVRVETAMGRVEVKGTLFRVRVDDDNAWVTVFKGTVDVVPNDEEAPEYQVAAGYGAELKQRATFRLQETSGDRLIQAVRIPPSDTPPDVGASEPLRAPVASLNTSGPQDVGAIGSDDAHVDRSEQIEKEILSGGRDDSEPRFAPSIKRLIGEARSCLLVRDWNCAASRYQEVLRMSSGRPGLTTVLISLAKIELRHLNRPRKALTHYKSYLKQAPEGPLAEEAFLGMADSYRHLGREDREMETLSRFIERFPNSSLLVKARIRLEQLAEAATL